jgi:hypothetical protein
VASRILSDAPGRQRPYRRPGGTACLGALATLVTGLALAATPASTTTPTPAHAPPATQADCQNLLKQFDVAWPAHRDSAKADSAHRNRDLGDSDCRDGHYTDAVFKLRRALHDIGVKPVKIVAPSTQR